MRTASKTSEGTEISEARALSVVDTALSWAWRRRSYTRNEVAGLLNDVVATVREPDLVEPVLSVIDHALDAFSDRTIVDRSFVVDVLLDLRLTFAPLPELA